MSKHQAPEQFRIPPMGMIPTDPRKQPWKAWNGGERPVPANQRVQFLCPFAGLQEGHAGEFNWQSREGAYRLVIYQN